jgi:uncharacterized Zn ribbon protein
MGCQDCSTLNKCYKCHTNFTLVDGTDFGYCFPKCFHHNYRKTRYESTTQFLKDVNMTELKVINPVTML